MPHGITDLVHCHQHNKQKTLIVSYLGSIGVGNILHTHNLDVVWNTVFISLTFLHFQHDFSYLQKSFRFPLVAVVLWIFQNFSITPLSYGLVLFEFIFTTNILPFISNNSRFGKNAFN